MNIFTYGTLTGNKILSLFNKRKALTKEDAIELSAKDMVNLKVVGQIAGMPLIEGYDNTLLNHGVRKTLSGKYWLDEILHEQIIKRVKRSFVIFLVIALGLPIIMVLLLMMFIN